MQGITSSQPEFQWLQQILDCCVTRKLLSYGQRRVYEAFQLLQTDPCVKVFSLNHLSYKSLARLLRCAVFSPKMLLE